MQDDESFTLVFEGNIRRFEKNPLRVETEFGTPYAVGVGDAFAKEDALIELMERAFTCLENDDVEGAMQALKEQL